jgi:alpha-glucosidase (family GH31 glycosyl hydrolase)
MRPLFFEFPTDSNTYDIYGQFLWGSGFMIVPVITQGATSVNAYFPVSRWFSYTNGAEIANPNSGRSINVQIGLYDLPGLYVRGGTIIPWQTPMQTTVQSRGQPFGLLVALDSNQAANGILYWDDGTTIDADTKGLYSFFTFQSVYKSNQYGILTIQRTNLGYVDTPTLNTIQVFGMYNKPTKVSVNGGAVNPSQIQYDTTNNAMTVTGLNLNLFSATATYQIQWNYF